MPNSVDTRIVEMEFDNARFERNVKQSIKTLQALDKQLQLTEGTKGFEAIEKASEKITFDKMAKSLSFIEYRLSAFGMTSAKIINHVTDKIGGMFSKLESISLGQIKSGGMARALKLEHANFMLDGLLKNSEKVKDIMDNAVSPAVDGTAYGLDAAANAASQFVASGIQDIDALKTALTGISGVAAMTGSEYEDIAHIFTKVAASGKMMGDEVMQLSTRGINAQAELAKYLNVTIDKVQEMQKKGQISFEIFANAMNDAFGEQAKKANDTYTGALSNLKAALSRVGADFATPYLNNMRDIFNALRVAINNGRKSLQPLVKLYTNIFNGLKDFTIELLNNEHVINIYTNVIKGMCRAVEILAQLLAPIRQGFLNAFPEGMVGILDDVTSRFLKFLYKLEFSKGFLKDIGDFLGGIFSALKLVAHVIEEVTGVSMPLFDGVNHFLGGIGSILGYIGRLVTAFTNMVTSNAKFNTVLSSVGKTLKLIIAVIISLIARVASFISSAKDLPIVRDLFNQIGDAAGSLANFILPKLAYAVGAVVYGFQSLVNLVQSGAISKWFGDVGKKIEDFYNLAKSGGGVFKSFAKIFKGDFKSFPGTIKASAKALDSFNNAVSDTVKPGGIFPTFKKISDGFKEAGGTISGAIDSIGKTIKKRIEDFGVARATIIGLSAGVMSLMFNISGVAKTVKNSFAGVPKLINAMTRSFDAVLYEAKSKALIIGLAVAIGALTVSLIALSMIKPERLKAAALAIIALVGAFTVAGLIANKLGGGFEGFKSVAFSFISFAGAMVLLCMALQEIASIELDTKALWMRILMLGTIMVALGGVLTAMTWLAKPVKLVFGVAFLIGFALSIKLLVQALAEIANLPLDRINAAMPALLKLMGGLALVSAACTMLNPLAGVGFFAIVASITAFIFALIKLAEILDPEKFEYIHQLLVDIYNTTKTWLIIFSIAVLVWSLKKGFDAVTQGIVAIQGAIHGVRTVATTIAVIGSLVVAVIAITACIAKLGTMDDTAFKTGAIRMVEIAAGIMVFLGGVMLMQKLLLGKKQFLSGLEKIGFSLAALIASLGFAMKALSGLSPDELNNGVVAIGEILLIITAFEVVSAILAKDSKAMQMGIKTALAMSALILAVTLAVGLLSMVSESAGWPNLLAASGAMLMIMIGLAAICYAMGQIKTGPAIAATIGMTVLFVALAGCMYLLQGVDWVQAGWTMAIILGSVAVMASIMYLLGKNASDAAKGMALVVGISAVFAVLTAIATYVQEVNWEVFASNMGVMLLAVAAMAAIMYIIGGKDIADNVTVGLAAVAGISLVFGILTIIATQLQSLDWTGVLANLAVIEGAIALMGVIMYFIGSDKFFKAIAKGTAIAAGMGLVFEIFAHVATILQNVQWQPFLANLAIIEGGVAVMGVIMFAIGKFAKEVALGALVTALMGVVLAGLAFVAMIVSKIDTEGFKNNIIALGLAVAGLAVIFGIIGIPAIAAVVALGAVVVGLMSLVLWGLSAVAKIVAALDGDAFGTNVEALAWGVAKLAVLFGIIGIPVIAGLVALGAVVVGGMALVMWGLAEVAKIVATIDTEGFNTAIDALIEGVTKFGIMMGILGAIVMTGAGAAILIAGAAALLVFAGVMYIFTGVAKSFAEAGVEVAAALELLAPAFEHVGQGLEAFSKSDFGGIVENLAGLAGSVWVLGQMSEDTQKAATSLTSLAEASNSSHQNIALVEADMMTLSASTTLLSTAATTIKDAFTDIAAGAKDAVTALSSTDIYAVVTEFANQFKTYSPAAMQSVGVKMVQDICSGMTTDMIVSVPPIVTDLVNAFNTAADEHYDQIYSAGAKIGATLVEGCRSSEGVDAHSDSWKFIGIAKDCINAIVHVFTDSKGEVGQASADIGKTITDKTAEGINSGKEVVSDALKDMVKDSTYTGKKEAKKDENNLGKTIDDETKEGIDENADGVLSGLKSFLSGLIGDGQAFLDANPLIMSVMVDTHGLTEAQRLGAEAEDKKRSDTYGYNTLEELQKAGQRGDLAHKWSHKGYENLNKETTALNKNSGATSKNSKAKKENEEANEGKTEAIDEETESLEGEEEQTGETSEEIRAMAEEIEVVTEEYKWLNHYIGLLSKNTGRIKRYQINAGKIWAGEYESIGLVTAKMKELIKAIPATVKPAKRGLYEFSESMDKVHKMYYIGKKSAFESTKAIKSYINQTGKTVAKVGADSVRVFYKVGNKIDNVVMNATTKMKHIPKKFKQAMNTIQTFAGDTEKMLNSYEWSDDVISHLRQIEDSFGKIKFKNYSEGIQNYLKGMRNRFQELNPAITQISRSLGGTYDVFNKNNRAAAASMDALVSLGAVLYNGSDAANEYATKIAQLEFLYEHQEISWEELQEAKIDYLTRIKDALLEYKQALEETYSKEVDMFTQFNKNELEKGTNILKTQMSNISGYYTYGEMLTELSRRTAALPESGQLVKQFADNGIESFGKLEAVLKLNNEELKAFIYGVGVLNKTQEEVSNKAFAAVSLATTYASKRQQARTKDIATKTTKYSAKVRKDIQSDMKAVAHAQQEYNILSKKEEKEYLKTLTNSEKKQYKKYKKEVKSAKNAFEAQRKLLEEQERVENIMTDIHTFDKLHYVLTRYSKDAKVMEKVNEALADSMKDVYKNTGESVTVTQKFMKFAEQLGAEGNTTEEFFNSINEKINSFRDGVKNALYDTQKLFEQFQKSTEKVDISKMISNATSQIIASTRFGTYISKMADMGFNNQAIQYIGNLFSSNQAQALQVMQELLKQGKEGVAIFNAQMKSYETARDNSMRALDQAIVKVNTDTNKEALDAAQSRLDSAKAAMEKIQNGSKSVVNKYGKQIKEASSKIDQIVNDFLSTKKNGTPVDNNDPYNNKTTQAKRVVNNILNASGTASEKLAAIEKVISSSSSVYLEAVRAYDEYNRMKEQLSKLEKAGMKNTGQYFTLQREISEYERKNKDNIAYKIIKLKEEIQAEKDAAQAELKAAQAAYDSAKANYDAAEAEKARLAALAAEQAAFEQSYYQATELVEKYADFAAAMNTFAGKSSYLSRAYKKVADALKPVNNALKYAKENFGSFDGVSKSALKEMSLLEEGFLKLADTLGAANDESGEWIENMGKRLEEYRKTLYDTIKGQVNLFTEFKKYSGEDPTNADTYLDYMQSQIAGLEEWTKMIEALAKRGVSGDILKMWAEQGQSTSFEQVMAFYNATDTQLGELISQYKRYLELTDESTDKVLASLAATFTDGAQEATDALLKDFEKNGKQRIAEKAYEAGAMVITGVKDGIGENMPTIISAVEHTAAEVSSKLTSGISSSQITSAVVAGLNDVDKAIAATMTVSLSGFYDVITEQAIEKFKMAVDSIHQYVMDTLPFEYTITIHVDTSEFDDAVARMNAAIYATNVNANQTSGAVAASNANQAAANAPIESTGTSNVTNVNYTQNNYSPKSLSQVEIYRNTQSQLNTMRNIAELQGAG